MVVTVSMGNGMSQETVDVWIGTSGEHGIYHCQLNMEAGRLSQPRPVTSLGGAGFLAVSQKRGVLYATAQQQRQPGVASYRIVDKAGKKDLQLTGFCETGDGGAACVAIDNSEQIVLSAQYGGGSTSTYLLDADGNLDRRVQVVEHGDGSGVDPNRQRTAHPHWVGTSPNNRWLLVPDLGRDEVVIYQLDSGTGEIQRHGSIDCPPGSGPRHMKFDPLGKFAYVLNELDLTVSVFQYDDQDASTSPVQVAESLPKAMHDKHLNSAAEIRFHPSGKFLYTSNRGHDSLSVFRVDGQTGKLELVQREAIRGSWPRNFNLDPSGKWLLAAGRRSNTLALFEVDQGSGKLTFTRTILSVPEPICVEFGTVSPVDAR